MRRLNPLISSLLPFLAATTLAAAPALHISDTNLSANGLTPNGSAVFFGVTRERVDAHASVRHYRKLVPVDSAGAALLALSTPPNSIWFVIDVRTGQAASGSLENSGFRSSAKSVSFASAGNLRIEADEIEILFVRPDSGVWFSALSDASDLDSDPSNGQLALSFSLLKPLGSQLAPPLSVLPGDVIAVILPRQNRFLLTRIER